VSSFIENEEPKQAQLIEEDALDQSSVADNWEDADLDAIDVVLEAKRVVMDGERGACVPDALEMIQSPRTRPRTKTATQDACPCSFSC